MQLSCMINGISFCDTLVNSYDIFFYIVISRIAYDIYYADEDRSFGKDIIVRDRIDPRNMTKRELHTLLESRGEIFSKNTERKRLEDLARSIVNVEESEPPVLADLEKLSIKELKQLLDQRGIMYYSKSSKEDLIIAVNISGPVTPEAVKHMKIMGEPEVGSVIEFNAFNINKNLDKHNESVHLINILPPRLKYSFFNESSWHSLRRKLSYLEFKFGELDCDFEKSVCLRQKWNVSTLYLYVPGKKVNTQYTIRKDYSLHAIFTDIQKSISHLVTEITSWETFASSQWAFYGGQYPVPIRIILFTNMTRPPMFFSALSVKYRKQVSFGMVNIESHKGRTILRKLKQGRRALCLVVTKTGILTYGKLPGEFFTYVDLELFLQNLLRDFQPDSKWYHKISYLLDPIFIVLLCIRFVSRNACKMLRKHVEPQNRDTNENDEKDRREEQEREEQEREENRQRRRHINISKREIEMMFFQFILSSYRRQQRQKQN